MPTPGQLAARLVADTSGFQAGMTQAASVADREMKKAANAVKYVNDYLKETARLEREAANSGSMQKLAADADRAKSSHAGVNAELLVLAHELSQGNLKQFGSSAMVLAEQLNVLHFATTGVGAAVIAVGAAVGGVAVLIAKGALEADAFNKSLVATNNYAGLTSDSLASMSRNVADLSGNTIGNAKEAMADLAATGRIGPAVIQQAAQAVIALRTVTGQSTEEIVKDFERMSDGVAKWAAAHNQQFHYLTAAQYTYIKQLEDQGKSEEAARENLRLLTEQMDLNRGSADKSISTWQAFKNVMSDFADAVKNIGGPVTTGSQIGYLQSSLDALESQRDQAVNPTPRFTESINANISALQEQIRIMSRAQTAQQGLAEATAKADADAQRGIAARDYVDGVLNRVKATSALTDALKKFRLEVDAAAKAGVPYSAADIKAGEDGIRKEFAGPQSKYHGGLANTPQQDFRSSELADNEKVMEAYRAAALQRQEAINAEMAKVHELDTAQQVFRRSELEGQEQVNAALRQQVSLQDEVDRRQSGGLADHAGEAFHKWVVDARDQAKAADEFVTGAISHWEDAMVNFAKTGKLSFSDLFGFIEEEMIRRGLANVVTGLFGSEQGGGGLIGGLLGRVFGNGHANGLDYVPYDGYRAVLHEGERVQSKQEARGGRGDGVAIDMSGAVYSFGAGVSASEVAQAIVSANGKLKQDLLRQMRTGRVVA